MTTEGTSVAGNVALITGATRRIGAAIARRLHGAGMNLALHYRTAAEATRELAAELEDERPNSVQLLQADLLESSAPEALINAVVAHWNRLDVLVNNASSFFPTPVGKVTEKDWETLLGSNLKAPFFLAQAALPELRTSRGCIINLIDIHADRPRDGHPVYSMAKAGLAMMTKSLAWELKPDIRVNGISPGAILWASNENDSDGEQQEILSRVPLGRLGEPDDIARTALFLIRDAGYINGQIVAVDGGRTLNM